MMERILIITGIWIGCSICLGIMWIGLTLFVQSRQQPTYAPPLPHQTRGIQPEEALRYRMDTAAPVNVCRICGPTPLALDAIGDCWKCAPVVTKVHAQARRE